MPSEAEDLRYEAANTGIYARPWAVRDCKERSYIAYCDNIKYCSRIVQALNYWEINTQGAVGGG